MSLTTLKATSEKTADIPRFPATAADQAIPEISKEITQSAIDTFFAGHSSDAILGDGRALAFEAREDGEGHPTLAHAQDLHS